jgi:hypothetical protein
MPVCPFAVTEKSTVDGTNGWSDYRSELFHEILLMDL